MIDEANSYVTSSAAGYYPTERRDALREGGVGLYVQGRVDRPTRSSFVHQKLYMSQSEALEAVGLSEQDAHADSRQCLTQRRGGDSCESGHGHLP